MNYTENEVRMALNSRADVIQLAEDYFWARYKADPEWDHSDAGWGFEGFRYSPSIEVSFTDDTVEVEASARACGRGCCGTDTHTYTFPLSYLWSDQTTILADIAAKAEAKKQAEAEATAKREAEAKVRQVAAEKKQLAELAKKYPDEVKRG